MGPYVPDGSYKQSSRNIQVTLSAECNDGRWWRGSLLNLTQIAEYINVDNIHGVLTPAEPSHLPVRGYMPDGSYKQSSRNIQVTLSAECQKGSLWYPSTLVLPSDQKINVENQDGQLRIVIPTRLPLALNTTETPTTIFFKNKPHVFYKGVGKDQRIYMSHCNNIITNQESWSELTPLPGIITTSASPSVVVLNNTLYIFYRSSTDSHIFIVRTQDLQSWEITRFPDTANTSIGPSAYISEGQIYVFYKGAHDDAGIYVMGLPSDSVWSKINS